MRVIQGNPRRLGPVPPTHDCWAGEWVRERDDIGESMLIGMGNAGMGHEERGSDRVSQDSSKGALYRTEVMR